MTRPTADDLDLVAFAADDTLWHSEATITITEGREPTSRSCWRRTPRYIGGCSTEWV
jgi:hypothetical protein